MIINRITSTTRVIAVNTPNSNTISSSWGPFRISVDVIEAATGYDLLSELEDNVENALEARVEGSHAMITLCY